MTECTINISKAISVGKRVEKILKKVKQEEIEKV